MFIAFAIFWQTWICVFFKIRLYSFLDRSNQMVDRSEQKVNSKSLSSSKENSDCNAAENSMRYLSLSSTDNSREGEDYVRKVNQFCNREGLTVDFSYEKRCSTNTSRWAHLNTYNWNKTYDRLRERKGLRTYRMETSHVFSDFSANMWSTAMNIQKVKVTASTKPNKVQPGWSWLLSKHSQQSRKARYLTKL